jgi:hypothetical protein
MDDQNQAALDVAAIVAEDRPKIEQSIFVSPEGKRLALDCYQERLAQLLRAANLRAAALRDDGAAVVAITLDREPGYLLRRLVTVGSEPIGEIHVSESAWQVAIGWKIGEFFQSSSFG